MVLVLRAVGARGVHDDGDLFVAGVAVWSFILGSSNGEIGGIHPHGDRKSPEAIERKGIAGVHCAARVRKR
jgi:hypothetical protein